MMRQELKDLELDDVVGGTVVMSKKLGIVGFNNLGESYVMKGDIKTMRNTMFDLQDEYAGKVTPTEFDTIVRDTFEQNGWI